MAWEAGGVWLLLAGGGDAAAAPSLGLRVGLAGAAAAEPLSLLLAWCSGGGGGSRCTGVDGAVASAAGGLGLTLGLEAVGGAAVVGRCSPRDMAAATLACAASAACMCAIS